MTQYQFKVFQGRLADMVRCARDLADGSDQAQNVVRDLAMTMARDLGEADEEFDEVQWLRRAGFPRKR